MNSRHLKIVASFISLIVPAWKGVVAKTRHLPPSKSTEQNQAQFVDQDRAGVFEKTHENCIPTKNGETMIEINDDAIHCVHGVKRTLLARLNWNGIEGWSTWINNSLLISKGIQGCASIYCRPVSIPGGQSLWISFLPDQKSRAPLRDELYARKVDA